MYICLQACEKWVGLVNNKEWTVQKLRQHYKIYDENYEYHYRLSSKDMAHIRRQLAAEIERHNLHKA